MVINWAGSRKSGKAAGARFSGTGEIDNWPVKSLPSGFLAVCGATVRVMPSAALCTWVVTAGSTVVSVAASIRGR